MVPATPPTPSTATRPFEWAFHATVSEPDNHKSTDVVWVCDRCTLENESADESCSACGQTKHVVIESVGAKSLAMGGIGAKMVRRREQDTVAVPDGFAMSRQAPVTEKSRPATASAIGSASRPFIAPVTATSRPATASVIGSASRPLILDDSQDTVDLDDLLGDESDDEEQEELEEVDDEELEDDVDCEEMDEMVNEQEDQEVGYHDSERK